MAKIAKRRDRWVLDFYDHQGKRRWITLPAGTTKKKAKDKLREIEDQIARGVFIPDKKIPMFKEVAEDWLEYKKPNVRSSTYDMYMGHLKNHLNEFNHFPVSRFTTARVEKFITQKRTAGMNLTTLRKLIVTLNQVMKYAVRHNYLTHNPLSNAERPKEAGKRHKARNNGFKPRSNQLFPGGC